jgi:hypothetical protein
MRVAVFSGSYRPAAHEPAATGPGPDTSLRSAALPPTGPHAA